MQQFTAGVHHRSLPWEFAIAVCHRSSPQEFITSSSTQQFVTEVPQEYFTPEEVTGLCDIRLEVLQAIVIPPSISNKLRYKIRNPLIIRRVNR
jgi:hypothetical protein